MFLIGPNLLTHIAHCQFPRNAAASISDFPAMIVPIKMTGSVLIYRIGSVQVRVNFWPQMLRRLDFGDHPRTR